MPDYKIIKLNVMKIFLFLCFVSNWFYSHSLSGVTLGSLRFGDWNFELSIDFDLDFDFVFDLDCSTGDGVRFNFGVLWPFSRSDDFLLRDGLLVELRFFRSDSCGVFDLSRFDLDFSREWLLRFCLFDERWCDLDRVERFDEEDDESERRSVEANFLDLWSSCNFVRLLLRPK